MYCLVLKNWLFAMEVDKLKWVLKSLLENKLSLIFILSGGWREAVDIEDVGLNFEDFWGIL